MVKTTCQKCEGILQWVSQTQAFTFIYDKYRCLNCNETYLLETTCHINRRMFVLGEELKQEENHEEMP